ncbi:MAG: holo-ACP synthase [Gammaproteobacteria bacterium]|nr:holo-ACP synthase [Gammaproteobacteria bacterium]
MISGIGVDIAETVRFSKLHEKYGNRFARRLLTNNEFGQFQRRKHPALFLASRFAAKEAAAKALGTGFDQGVGYKSIEVKNESNGKPLLCFYGVALQLIEQRQISRIFLSLSDEKHYAVAMVILEAD